MLGKLPGGLVIEGHERLEGIGLVDGGEVFAEGVFDELELGDTGWVEGTLKDEGGDMEAGGENGIAPTAFAGDDEIAAWLIPGGER